MKINFKFLIIAVVTIWATMPMFAFVQENPDPGALDTSLPLLKFILAYGIGTFSGVLLDALKHVFAATFKWKPFWEDALKPLLFAFGGGALIYLVQRFVPSLIPMLESAMNVKIEMTIASLLVSGAIISATLKQIFQRKAAALKSK